MSVFFGGTASLNAGKNTEKRESEIKAESAMLTLLIEYLTAEKQTEFTFVASEPDTCSKHGEWLAQSLLLNSSQAARQ